MAKSTLAQAHASLKLKFQAKIREVGQLKKAISEQAALDPVIKQLRDDVAYERACKNQSQFELERAEVVIGNQRASIADLKGDVSNLKSLCGIASVLSAIAGAAGMYAYFTL